ncbi:alpha/beta fold hydrolase [Rhodopila sp.]|uniref:alpha/beta fold hydrolase n=1 Tax=Rhodopila sp. TaxID=2480087 RepID=UPI003D140F43
MYHGSDRRGKFASNDKQTPFPRPMIAVSFNGCFGWYHACEQGLVHDVAVVLCPALLRDALDSHHAFRLMANTLADAGYPTIRFDYPGTGDSLDISGDHWHHWNECADAAAEWIRATTGASHLVFIGLRIGATIAATTAAHRTDVIASVLLAPVVRGRSYVRQLQIEAQLHGSPPSDALVYHELQIDAVTLAQIAEVDLRNLPLPTHHRCFIVAQSQTKQLVDCARLWSRRGLIVTVSTDFGGLETMLAHNEQGDGQPFDFHAILEWLQDAAPLLPVWLRPVCRQARPPTPVMLAEPGWVETPLAHGRDLFGMMCEPDSRPAGLVVIIANTGRDPHYGAGRFGTNFARALARQGIASLRIDFAGFGDSRGHPGLETVPGSMFETDRLSDFQAALDLLQARGYKRFVVNGLCAGAYHAWHAALRDQRIEALLLLNLPAFEWKKGDTVEFVQRLTSRPDRYLAMLRQKEVWLSLIQGKFDLPSIARAQVRRRLLLVRDRGQRLTERILRIAPKGPRRSMAELQRRGVETLFMVAPDDRGANILEQEFGPGFVDLSNYQGATAQTVARMDHSVTSLAIQNMVMPIMLDFVCNYERTKVHDYSSHCHSANPPGRGAAEQEACAADRRASAARIRSGFTVHSNPRRQPGR